MHPLKIFFEKQRLVTVTVKAKCIDLYSDYKTHDAQTGRRIDGRVFHFKWALACGGAAARDTLYADVCLSVLAYVGMGRMLTCDVC